MSDPKIEEISTNFDDDFLQVLMKNFNELIEEQISTKNVGIICTKTTKKECNQGRC